MHTRQPHFLLPQEYKIPSNQFYSSQEKLHSWLFCADAKRKALMQTLGTALFCCTGTEWQGILDHQIVTVTKASISVRLAIVNTMFGRLTLYILNVICKKYKISTAWLEVMAIKRNEQVRPKKKTRQAMY
jgi:hypothetical protein